MKEGAKSYVRPVLPRNEKLPLFDPHIPDFVCASATSTYPLLDAQAHTWFLTARALESEDIFYKDRDYKSIVELTRSAADRMHWKAMLNLASLYIEKHDPQHGPEDAVKLVEKAMQLGIPEAYDRMGTYYLNGTGVSSVSGSAKSFFYKAALMGSGESMWFLGKDLVAREDEPDRGWWANRPVAVKMLECSLGRGYGGAAWDFATIYRIPHEGVLTNEGRWQALRILQQGVRLGGQTAARSISAVFRGNFGDDYALAPPDIARRQRYSVLSRALEFDPSDRFPNLDKVLPLPPAALPPWNGDRDTLLNAARGVTAPPPVTGPTVYSKRTGRYFLDQAFLLEATDYVTTERSAPFAGYWQPVAASSSASGTATSEIMPGLYEPNEAFERTRATGAGPVRAGAEAAQWQYFRTVHNPSDTVRPLAPAGMTVVRPRPLPLLARSSDQRCPRTGTWQPWVAETHPLSAIVNQPWRQAWVTKGQDFPVPERDWFLKLPAADITWHLMDDSPVDIQSPPKSPDGKERPIEK